MLELHGVALTGREERVDLRLGRNFDCDTGFLLACPGPGEKSAVKPLGPTPDNSPRPGREPIGQRKLRRDDRVLRLEHFGWTGYVACQLYGQTVKGCSPDLNE